MKNLYLISRHISTAFSSYSKPVRTVYGTAREVAKYVKGLNKSRYHYSSTKIERETVFL